MRPVFGFFPDEFFEFQSIRCIPVFINITDDNINEAEQIFVVKISVDPDLQDEITSFVNVSLVHIIDNDGEYNITVLQYECMLAQTMLS